MRTPTIEMRLKPEIIEKIKKSKATKARLALELNKSFLTIQRWLKANSVELTKIRALTIVSQELNCPINELATEPQEA